MIITSANSTDGGQIAAPTTRETSAHPEFYRLPTTGGDPFFGLTRSFYYEGENRGYWRLVRLRERGRQRGVTLVPYDAVATFVHAQATKGDAR